MTTWTPSTDLTEAPLLRLETTMGVMMLEMYSDDAPVTVANFLRYVDEGFYDGSDGSDPTIFHRVIADFMIQGGGMTEALQNKSTHGPIVNESGNGRDNLRGTLAMARTEDLDSATSQFFINHIDNAFLDGGDAGDGYAVFGEVVEGLEVLDLIAAVPTYDDGFIQDVPENAVIITGLTRE